MLLTNLKAATMQHGYGLIVDAAILIEDGKIAWVGPRAEAPSLRPRLQTLCLCRLGGRLGGEILFLSIFAMDKAIKKGQNEKRQCSR